VSDVTPPGQRVPLSWRRANPAGVLMLLRSKAGLTGLAAVNFLSHLAGTALASAGVL
jgi:hypothetical protein